MTADLAESFYGGWKAGSNNRTLVDRYYEKFDGQGHLIFEPEAYFREAEL